MTKSIRYALLSATLAFGVAGCGKHNPKVISITADNHGFTPANVQVKKGDKVTLRFTRTSDQTCAKKVVFPGLGITKPLPLNQSVDIPLPTTKAGTVAFVCGMGMLKGSVVVD